ncbi:lytic transglycosylase domain-containing protein [Desulforhopalus sp. IMCC35007]|uniref:lytic transglycosylase domain-containing protein n=1 Tax=Desulforhopalus sp. IMCC35007 TaxID=2569543 RepID=UPI0010AEC5BE|nr:transglycosylase SLT domain-containing protein [Desulforhopalus sp. IMCC35007]TKB10350.1 lytic transglycosylase domain-containing protein [Desulforhopalus sp. IMCC35007]
MKKVQPRIVFIFTLMFILQMSAPPVHSGLYESVRKYKDSEVSLDSIERLKRYDHLIRYFCNFSYFVPNHKVSADFVRALILAESSANHRAVSSKEAFGLGQILLTTGQEAGQVLAKSRTNFRYVRKHKLKNLTRADLFDPAINILLTCYLIAKYNTKFDGKLDLVVSAWNAGENTQSLKNGRHAPYEETENLIGKVNAYYVYLLRNRVFPAHSY